MKTEHSRKSINNAIAYIDESGYRSGWGESCLRHAQGVGTRRLRTVTWLATPCRLVRSPRAFGCRLPPTGCPRRNFARSSSGPIIIYWSPTL